MASSPMVMVCWLAFCAGCTTPAEPPRIDAAGAPRVFLWAWERNEDLRFLAGSGTGVAFLATTIEMRADTERLAPRRQPLRVPEDAWLTAVVRLESPRSERASLSWEQRSRVVQETLRVAGMPGVRAVQIDFDAAHSERPAYRVLLAELRAALPSRVGLSMTALASWCLFDSWIEESGVPVDEVVPMVFAMGHDTEEVWRHLDERGDFRVAACRAAVGVQAGQRIPAFASERRVYVFSERPWDLATWSATRERLRR